MGLSIDTSGAESFLEKLDSQIFVGATLASKEAAQELKRELENAVPVRTGLMKGSFRLLPAKGARWWVRVRRRSYPGFFYALMFVWLFRYIAERDARKMRQRMKLLTLNYIRSRIHGA